MAKKKATKSKEYKIVKKRSGRFAVVKGKKNVNGDEKVKILVKEGLIKAALPKEKPAEEAEAPAAE